MSARAKRGSKAEQVKAPPGPTITRVPPERMERAIRAAKLGCSLQAVAAMLGVGVRVLKTWLARADEPLENARVADHYRQLAERLALARGEYEQTLAAVALAGAAGKQDLPDPQKTKPSPKLALALLERRFPETWGHRSRQQLEVTGEGGGALGVRILLPKLLGDDTDDGRRSR